MAASRAVRIIVGVVVAIVVVVVVAALALPSIININQYHDKIQAQLQQALGRPVTLGKMELKIIPLKVRIADVNIGEDPNFHTGRAFATAQELDVSAKLLPLLRKEVELNSLELVKPQVELVRNAQGVWNYASLGKTSSPAAAPNGPAAPSTNNPPQQTTSSGAPVQQNKQSANANNQLSIAELKMTDGTVAVTDNTSVTPPTPAAKVKAKAAPTTVASAGQRAVYDHIDLTLQNYAPNKAFDFDVTAHLPGPGTEQVALSGTAGPIKQGGDATATPVNAKLSLKSVEIAALQKFLKSDALKDTNGVASGELALKNNNGNFSANGSLTLGNGKLHGVELGYPIKADIDAKGDLASAQYQINKGDFKLGPTPISISGNVNAKPTPMIADIHLKASDASLKELARLASAFGVAFAPGTEVAGKLNADVSAKGPVDNPAMNGTIRLANVQASGADIKQPVHVPSLNIALTPNQMKADPFTVTTGGTNLNVAFTLDNYTQAATRAIDATLKTQQTQLEDLLNIAHAYGVQAADGISGTGQVALDARAQGPLADTAKLSFSGTGALRNSVLNLPSLTKPVNIGNADIRFSQNTATLQNLQLGVGSTHAGGNLSVSNFASPNLQFALNADKIDVAEMQTLVKAPPSAAPQKAEHAELRIVPRAEAAAPKQSSVLETITGGGQLSVGQILYQGITLNNTKSTVALDHGVIRMAPLTSELFGGNENGTIIVDTRPAQPTIAVNTSLQKVDANKLLSATTSLKQVVFGLLNAGGNLGFTSVANGDIASTLNGTLNLNLQNGKITGIDLLKELGQIAKFGAGGNGVTNIAGLSGAFNIRNGLAHTDNLKASIDGGTVAGVGDINLASQQLNMKLTAVLNSAMSKQVGGTGIGGYLNTALANRSGELVIPVLVTGSFSSPHFAPDLQQLAQMKLKNLLPTTGNPAGALSGLLGGATGGGNGKGGALGQVLGALGGNQQNANGQNNDQQQQQQQQPSPQDAVKGLLNRLGKKPK